MNHIKSNKMPISIIQSSDILLDTPTDQALKAVMATLNKQAEEVLSVEVLANFSIDNEAAMFFDFPLIVQGLVVRTTRDYRLSREDQSWFHPCVARSRSMFKVTNPVRRSLLKAQELSGIQNSVGEYSMSHPDEFGCEEMEYRVIADTDHSSYFRQLYNKWLDTGVTAGHVEKEWKNTNFDGIVSATLKTLTNQREIVEKILPSAKLLYTDTVNSVLSDTTSVYFTNAAVKAPPNKQVLVKASGLGGYRMFVGQSGKRFYPAHCGISPNFYSWSNLDSKTCSRIEETCSWGGDLPFNTQVMRPPSVKNVRILEDACDMTLLETLVMRHAAFSGSDSIADKMTPQTLLKLTPDEGQSSKAMSYISAPLSMGHPVLSKLMENLDSIEKKFPNFKLFNKEYVKSGRLELPKEIYKHIL